MDGESDDNMNEQSEPYQITLTLPALRVLTGANIVQIDRALAEILDASGDGAVHLVVRNGKLRFCNVERWHDATFDIASRSMYNGSKPTGRIA